MYEGEQNRKSLLDFNSAQFRPWLWRRPERRNFQSPAKCEREGKSNGGSSLAWALVGAPAGGRP